MKTTPKNKSLFLIACVASIFTVFQNANARPEEARSGEALTGLTQTRGSIGFETFYHELAPYGRWVDDRAYGRVWIPDVPRGFHPYMTEGYWVMTEYGNTWVSNYSWGWAPFHYGRWNYDDYYGWMWIPGTEWGPAWVAWRNGGGYYGWAPLGPRININVSVNIGRYIPNTYWTFVKYGHFTRHNVYRYCAPRRQVTNIINHTTIINNTYVQNGRHTYYTGPRTHDIERTTHKRVRVHNINQMDRPGTTVVRNGAVNVYRPSGTARSSRVNESNISRSKRETEYQNRSTTRSNSSTYRNNTAPRSRDSYAGSRQNIDDRNSRSTRSYPATPQNSRSTLDNSRAKRTYESQRESSTYRNSAGSGSVTDSQLQRQGRSSAPQRNITRESTPNRSRNSSIQRPTSPAKSSGQSSRSSSGGSTYQRGSRSSSSSAVRSGSSTRSTGSKSTERSTQGRSSRSNSNRSGNN